jgi:hypothetical protein
MKPEHILPDFKRGLDRFNEAMALNPVDDVHRAGCIQYFEFTFDLAWKSIQSAIRAVVCALARADAGLAFAFSQWVKIT